MPAPALTIRLLGGFEVSADSRTIVDQTWARKRPLSLIKLLALQPRHQMLRNEMLAELWPELSQAAAATQLRKTRLYVRQALRNSGWDVDLVQASGAMVRLLPDLSVDTELFERAARQALADGADITALTDAVKIYRGDLLPDDLDEPWADHERTRLRGLYHETLFALSSQLEAIGDILQATEAARQITDSDRLNEAAHRTLMRLHAADGRRDLALRQYETLRAILRSELDVAPDDETERLLRGIKHDRATATHAGAPLLGRSAEVHMLREAFDRTRASSGQFIILRGEAGIGKTRLADWLADHARQSGAHVHYVRSHDNESRRGFDLWMRVIEGLSDAGAAHRSSHPAAGAPAEPASRMHRLVASDSIEPDALFFQVGELLRRHASVEPLVLVFDDLQWCAADSLRLLQTVSRMVSGASMMLLGTVRSEGGEASLASSAIIEELLQDRGCRVIELQGLRVEDVSRLIAMNHLGGDLDAGDLWTRTHGNPLFVTEMLITLQSDPATDLSMAVPSKVTSVIRKRISRLSRESRGLLEFGSALGGAFSISTLSRTSGLSPTRVLELMDEAHQHAIVSVSEPSGEVTFVHPLMGDVVYLDIGIAQRAAMHLKIARALEAHYGSAAPAHSSELAYHYARGILAGGEDEALRFLVEAGSQALAELAFEDAGRHFEAALAVALDCRPADRAHHGEIRLQLGNALYRSYDGTQRQRSARVLALALNDARAAAAPQLFARVVAALTGKRTSGLGVSAENVELLREAISLVDEHDHVTLCDLSGRLAKELEGEGDDATRLEAGRRAVALAQGVKSSATSGLAMLYGLDAIAGPDTLEERLTLTRDLVALRLPRGESVTTQGHLRRYVALVEAADVASAEVELAQLIEAANAHPVSTTRRWAERWSTLLAADRAAGVGHFERADELAQRGLTLGQGLEDPDALSIFGAQVFQIRWHQGRAAELAGLASNVVASAPGFSPWSVASALIQFSAGEDKAAKAAFDRLAARGFRGMSRDRFWAVTLTVAAELCVRLGDLKSAAELLTLVEPFAGRIAVLGFGQVSGGSMARTAGQLCTLLGEWDRAEMHFEEARRANTAIGSLVWVAWTELAYARMLVKRDRPSDAAFARVLLASATETARECGMVSVAAEAQLLG